MREPIGPAPQGWKVQQRLEATARATPPEATGALTLSSKDPPPVDLQLLHIDRPELPEAAAPIDLPDPQYALPETPEEVQDLAGDVATKIKKEL